MTPADHASLTTLAPLFEGLALTPEQRAHDARIAAMLARFDEKDAREERGQ